MATTEVVSAKPAPELAGFVDGYLGYRLAGFAPGVHRGLPSRHLTFIVAIGPPIDVIAQTDPRQSPAAYRCVVSGLQATPALIEHTGYQEGVAISLTPLGSRLLFGMPAAELWNQSVEGTELLGAQLADSIQSHHDWQSRFAACDRVLREKAIRDQLVSPELAWAWATLTRTDGTASITDLANHIGWTRQHLTRRFTAEFGTSPKTAARVIRFDRAKQLLTATPSYVSIAQIAAACGYYDQAHLNRDFLAFAGVSPTAWLAEEVPSVQDDGPLTGRG
ncbi:helix-turn-helix domain-containing protein [Nocardia camponoti]|uniref:AraC family transcriptional regulator n=1 Tax=Nocardia camponoti TaxID=1616106 RepID=A0A917QGF7_9NOCA|nr:helix-turn-helix domain-containing protein [Nocardia camponoti]GGK47885.1 AraC family transcriptional regulator [Nocardia camponoti]